MKRISSIEYPQNPEIENKKLPAVSVFIFRHGETKTSEEDPKRRLIEEGEKQVDNLGDMIAQELGDPNQYIINPIDAENLRARQSTDRVIERLRRRGFDKYLQPIKIGKGGFTGKEELITSNQPRQHRTYAPLRRKIFTAEMTTPNGERATLKDYYFKILQDQGVEHPSVMQILQAWLTDEKPVKGIETPNDVKVFFQQAIEHANNDIPALKEILPEGKSIVTIIGANNPKVDLLLETVTGMDRAKQEEEIVSNAEGCRVDFYPNQPPVFSVFGDKLEKKFSN